MALGTPAEPQIAAFHRQWQQGQPIHGVVNMGKIGVGASAVMTVEPWDGRRVVGHLSADIAALLPFPLTTLEVGMTYQTNQHLLERRMGQVRGAGYVYDHIRDVVSSAEYFVARKATESSVEFELVKWVPARQMWVTVWLKALKGTRSASKTDEIWVSSGFACPRDDEVDKDIASGRLIALSKSPGTTGGG